MTSIQTFRAALSTNALMALCALLALMAYYQTTDLYELSYTTSVAWTSTLESVSNWISIHFSMLKSQFGAIVNAPADMNEQFQNNGNAVTGN